MTAKEKFEAIGWEDISEDISPEDHYYITYKTYKKHYALIEFFDNGLFGKNVEAEICGEGYPLSMKELDAIYTQCKELGWLE